MFPLVILSNSFKQPATALGKVLGKTLVCVLPRFPKDHLLTLLEHELPLHSHSVIFSMLSDSTKCLLFLGKPMTPCFTPQE